MSSPMPEAEQEWSATPFENPDAYIRLLRLMEVRSQIDVLAFEAKALTMELEAIIPKTALFVDPAGIPWRGTVVRPDDTIDVDLAALESRWPELYIRLTKRVVDRKALNKALRAGAVTQEVAQATMSTHPNSPSVRLTRVDAAPEEEPLDD